MKKYFLILFALFFSSNLSFAQEKMSFERTGTIYLYSFRDKSELRLFDGYQQSVSPTANAIAFTETDSMGNRFISQYNLLPSGELAITQPIMRYTAVPGNNSYEPKFSPDGNYVLFNYWNGNDWDIAIVNADNSNYINITEPYRVSTGFASGFYSPSWSPDSKSILTHDMNEVYEFDLQGNLLKKYSLTNILSDNRIFLSSSSVFLYDKNKTYLIFDAENELFFDNLHEPINGIYSYDINNKSVKMISPMEHSSMEPEIFYEGNKIYFSAFGKNDITVRKNPGLDMDYYELKFSIFSMDMDGGNVKKIITDAYSPSITK